MKCKRCGYPEDRVHGFCSTRCEELFDAEEEAELMKARAESAESSLAALREQTRWIPVEERLPEKRHPVLVLTKYGNPKVRMLLGNGDSLWWLHSDDNFCDDLEFITAWRPIDLPDADKEGKE